MPITIKKKKFSLKEYYISKFLKLYLPLTVIVFSTISFLSLSPDILLPSLKPEVKSILLGYNNFWQLSANMDYFAQHINSPFMHLWYVAILLQFDLLFPLIYIPLRKLGDNCHKLVPCILTILLSIGGVIYFYLTSQNQNIMISYYNTFSRLFSLLFGLCLGMIHHYHSPLICKKMVKKTPSLILFTIYLLILITLFITVDANSQYFQISMIITTLITCRIIDYSINLSTNKNGQESTINQTKKNLSQSNNSSKTSKHLTNNQTPISNKIIKYLSSISYEFYLLQYPLIFFLQYVEINNNIKLTIITPLLLALSYIYHSILSKNRDKTLIKYIFKILLMIITIFGIYKFILTKDNTQEMNELKAELAANESLLAEQQEEYTKNFQAKQAEFENAMQDLLADESKLPEMVSSITAVAMGDSVMENNAKLLYKKFPNMYIDAKYCRVASYAVEALADLKAQDKLGNPIILEFGANGDCTEAEKNKIMEICEGKQVFWLTVPNDRIVKVNDKLFKLAEKYNNLHIIDWYTITRPHEDYFISDKVHLTAKGREAFTEVIYNAIYDYYAKEFTNKKEELEKLRNETLTNNISFYGNELLTNIYKDLQLNYPEAKYSLNKNLDYKTLKETIQKEKSENTLNKKLVFLLDSSFNATSNDWNELLKICENQELIIVSTSSDIINKISSNNIENLQLIDFSIDMSKTSNYIAYDKTHLSNEGTLALISSIKKIL